MSDKFSEVIDLKENPRILEDLKLELARSGVSVQYLVTQCDLHPSLTTNRIQGLLAGSIKLFPIDEYTSIYSVLKSLPDKVDPNREKALMIGYVSITPEIINEIETLMEKTGLGPTEAIRKIGNIGLSPQIVWQWFNGSIKSASQEKLQKLLIGWRKLPEIKVQNVTPEISEFIKGEIERTGIGPMAVLRGNVVAREIGLTSNKIKSLINLSRDKILTNELEIIKDLWKGIPDKSNTHKQGYMVVSKSLINKIKSEIERTGCGASKVLRGNKKARDIGLRSSIINYWIKEEKSDAPKSKTAKTEHIELAEKLWDNIPNKEDVKPKKQVPAYVKAREMHRNSLLED